MTDKNPGRRAPPPETPRRQRSSAAAIEARLERAWGAQLQLYELPERLKILDLKRRLNALVLDPQGSFGIKLEPVDVFVLAVSAGYYPPPKAMLAIAAAFRSYIEAKGTKDLENTFFGRVPQCAGNWSKRRARERQLLARKMFIASRKVYENKSQISSAEAIAANRLKLDPQTIASDYRKSGGKEFEQVLSAMTVMKTWSAQLRKREAKKRKKNAR